MEKSDLTILFLSCDKYSDLWDPLLYCFRKYWKKCPYPVVLGSNTIASKKIKTILSGPDKDWSTSLLSILDQVNTPYIFLWLDDIFPISEVNEKLFSQTLQFMKKNKAKHVHVSPKPMPDTIIDSYGEYKKGAPYRATVFGFWEVKALKKILLPGETPWNFEIMGSYRSSYSDGYYCTMNNLIDRLHMVEKGKFFQTSYEYCQKHAISLNSDRQILRKGYYVKSELQKIYFNAMIRIPWRLRLGCMNILRKLFITY